MAFTQRQRLAIRIRGGLVRDVGDEVVQRIEFEYGGGMARSYHNLDHAYLVLSWANWACDMGAVLEPIPLRVAALAHDCVYDRNGSPANEERSAAVLDETPLDWAVAAAAKAHILATSKHGQLREHDVSNDTALMLDCDMIGFAEQRRDLILDSDDNIVAELLCTYTQEQISAGRGAFLRKLLANEHVYLHPLFRERFEKDARASIAWLIAERYAQLPLFTKSA